MPLTLPARVGRVYFAPGTYGTVLSTVGVITFTPVLFENGPVFADQIGITTTVAATGAPTVRLGVYKDRGGVPGELVFDSGDISGMEATAGAKYATMGNMIDLSARPLWLASLFSTAATTQVTVAALTAGAQPFASEMGVADFTALPIAAASTPNGLRATFAYAALPVDASTLTLTVLLNTAVPLVGLRALV